MVLNLQRQSTPLVEAFRQIFPMEEQVVVVAMLTHPLRQTLEEMVVIMELEGEGEGDHRDLLLEQVEMEETELLLLQLTSKYAIRYR